MSAPWSLLELLKEALGYLAQKGVPTPRLDAEILLAHALQCRRIDLYLRHDQPLAPEEVDRFRELIRRRSRREPVAYITGTKEFWSLPFTVTPRVLIPRPETELLVEVALEAAQALIVPHPGPLRILEIGTGSGAVAIALAREGGERFHLVATDRSSEALQVARANARALGVDDRIEFLQGDLLEPLGSHLGPFVMILSNPPYVPSREIPILSPEVREYEPRDALDGGEDGLAVIRRLLQETQDRLAEEGSLLLEVGAGQRPFIEETLRQTPSWRSWRWHQDLAGVDRVLSVTLS
jgi:release factor glutamine methyltransferase